MKKLAIVALALVLAMTFVGCGAANLLVGTKWDTKFGELSYARFDFQKDNVCKYYWASIESAVKNEEVKPLDYTWTAEGNTLTINTKSGGEYGVYEVEIKGNEMTWVNTKDEKDVINLTRVTDAE
ncbi:MAG: lipocalin family protein [Spirochaetaceae bacterium]|nr:lipocalin family protein [Spirochaetaceae bacterium]